MYISQILMVCLAALAVQGLAKQKPKGPIAWPWGRLYRHPRPPPRLRGTMASTDPPTINNMGTGSPRLVMYQQTHHDPHGNPVSLLPLITEKTGITHLYIAAIHLNGGKNVTLNDHAPDDPRNDQLWREVRQLQDAGIKVMAMLGGAAKGSFAKLSGPQDLFEENYATLRNVLDDHGLQGVDLDIEETMALADVRRLIRRLRSDYGPEFIITLAPVYPALLPRHRIARSLVHRLLNASDYPAPDPLTASVCQARHLHNKRNLSGFNHLELETSAEARFVNWYNVQVYCNWGDPTGDAYDQLVEAGWRPERLVLGVVTNRGNGAGWYDVATIAQVARRYRQKYGLRFGGVMGWEYFNAGMDRQGAVGPWEWVRDIGAALGLV